MTTAAIQSLERAASLDDLAAVHAEIGAALRALKQQPGMLTELQVHAKLEAAIKKHDSATQAAAAWGITKQTLSACRQGLKPVPPSILRHLGLKRVAAGRTMYREL